MRKTLCHSVIREKIVSDGSSASFVSQQLNVGNLQFKDSCISDQSDIIKLLKGETESCCNDYLRNVVDFEAIIYYFMAERSLGYDAASKCFKFG